MQLKPISQQVVAVVGASSGIGGEAALQFAKHGAKFVVSARGESKLKSLVEEIHGFGGEATQIVADVQEFAQVKAIADQAMCPLWSKSICTPSSKSRKTGCSATSRASHRNS